MSFVIKVIKNFAYEFGQHSFLDGAALAPAGAHRRGTPHGAPTLLSAQCHQAVALSRRLTQRE